VKGIDFDKLPQGLEAFWSANVITITGTPTQAGPFQYSIGLDVSCGEPLLVAGTITVTPATVCPTATITYNSDTYSTVSIGDQCWMAENLRTRKYMNGEDIPFDKSGGAGGGAGQTWSALTSGAHTLYAHDSTASSSNLNSYGYLYNWYSVNDFRKLCPLGWHVPTDDEWTTLTSYLGEELVAGGKMKSTVTQPTTGGWNTPNTGATNESGFSALPGGYRDSDGSFSSNRGSAYFWSATEVFNAYVFYRKLESSGGDVGTGNFISISSNIKSVGASVRCLKD
jgi:uncharacterized protein (TIGR02145 family)